MTYRIQKVHDLIDETDIAWNMFLNYLQLSSFFNLHNLMDEKEKRYYVNKLCSDLALICEKYSKALYLKTATLPESVVSRLNLTDDDVVNIIIGSEDPRTKNVYSQFTKDEKKIIQELKFHGIRHNFTKLYKDDKNFLKNISSLFNFAMRDFNSSTKSESDELLFSENTYDAFVKGRYSSLNDYDGNLITLLSLCEVLQNEIIKGENFFDMDCVEISIGESNFDVINAFYDYKKNIDGSSTLCGGYQPRFRTIKHIYPVLGSKLTVESDGIRKEYFFGKHKNVSLYKYVTQGDGINRMIKKDREEVLADIENAPLNIGLYSNVNGANCIIELNNVYNSSGLSIKNGDFITFEDATGLHYISNCNGQLIFVNGERIQKNNDKGKK